MALSPRLSAVAALVRPGATVADIGTDHARLPIHLVRQGLVCHCIASDVAAGPLCKAAENLAAAGLTDAIELRQGNGLFCFSPDEVDDIVIAGMGGETVAEILADSAFSFSARHRLILQPMSHPERLAAWLDAAGFSVLPPCIVAEGRRQYTVFYASFS